MNLFSVWSHLLHLAATKNTTIILTTHYIEEAKSSSTIGIMRNGRIIAEDAPSNLLRTHKVSSLETLFLALCKQQEIEPNWPASLLHLESIKTLNSSTPLINDQGYNIDKSVERIKALCIKNCKVTFRNVW